MAEYQYGGQNTLTFRKLPGFKNIIAWQKASELARLIDAAVSKFGPGYYKLADQMRSAAISVAANIAEGYGRAGLGEYIHFCLIARGSLFELGSYIQDCEQWGRLQGEELQTILKAYGDTTFFLDRLIQGLKGKQRDQSWDKEFKLKEDREPYITSDEPLWVSWGTPDGPPEFL